MRVRELFGLKSIIVFSILIGFQNCSPVNFAVAIPEKVTKLESTPQCSEGEVFDGVSCIIPATGCEKQVRLEPVNGEVVVPARDGKGTCYYVKLFSKRGNEALSTDSSLPQAEDVVAADHDSPRYYEDGFGYFEATKHPLVLGGNEFGLTVQGQIKDQRTVVISADSAEAKDLYVDNFILLEVNPGSRSKIWVRGTRDIFPKFKSATSQQPIWVGGDSVFVQDPEFVGMAVGGTESVKSADISSLIPYNERVTFRARALDCGLGKKMSDGWLLFK